MISLFLFPTTNYGDLCQDDWHDTGIGGYFIGKGISNYDHNDVADEKQRLNQSDLDRQNSGVFCLWDVSTEHLEGNERFLMIDAPMNLSAISIDDQNPRFSTSQFNSLKLNFLRGSNQFKQKYGYILPRFKRNILTEN